MKIDPSVLTGGELNEAWSEPFGGDGPMAELTLRMKFARVSERRAALLDDKDESKGVEAVREFYCNQITGWNVTAPDGSEVEFSQQGLRGLLELEPGLEGYIVREVQDLSRFL